MFVCARKPSEAEDVQDPVALGVHGGGNDAFMAQACCVPVPDKLHQIFLVFAFEAVVGREGADDRKGRY